MNMYRYQQPATDNPTVGSVRTHLSIRYCTGRPVICGKKSRVCPGSPGVFEPVKSDTLTPGEPGRTRDTHGTGITGKKTPGGAGTHTGHTSAHADTRRTQTNLTTKHPNRKYDTPARAPRQPKPFCTGSLLLHGRARSSHAVRRKTDLLLPDSLLACGCSGLYMASSRGGALEYRASLVRTEYYEAAAASALDARAAAWYIRTIGRGPPSPSSEHRRQSISSPRSLRFAAWSSAAPLAGGPGRSASSSLRLRRRQPSVRVLSGARLAPAPCSTRGPS